MYKLLKVAFVILPLAICTFAKSNCKCRDKWGNPKDSVTQYCCSENPLVTRNYLCDSTVYSFAHHRCDCNNDGLLKSVQEWSDCCYLNGAQSDIGHNCAVG